MPYIVGAAVVLGVLAFASYLLAIAAVYLLPLLWLLAMIAGLWGSLTAPRIPDAAAFDPPDATAKVAAAAASLRAWAQMRSELYGAGATSGIMLTRGSGETRFHAGSRKGRELNAAIEQAEQKIDDIKEQIGTVRANVRAHLPPWSEDYRRWVRRTALRAATFWSVMAFAVALVVMETFWRPSPMLLEYSVQVLPWRTALSVDAGLIPLAALAAYIAFGVAFLKVRGQRSIPRPSPELDAWNQVVRKWSWTFNESDFLASAETESRSQQRAERPPAREAREEWAEVLGVRADASVDEIKSAYRTSMKDYHSDRVATLGEKLRKLAEEETKRINAAYAEAKRQRGFN